MNPSPLPPIPSPPSHHWRQFRINVLPYVTFTAVLLGVIWLWGRNLATPLLTGQVEGPEADIISPRAGQIAQLKVTLNQEVKVGDVIAIINIPDPTVLSNTLNLARAEMQEIQANGGFRPTDKVRYATFEFDWLNLRAELASLEAECSYAKIELDRASHLLEAKLISQEEYDLAKTTFDVKQQSLTQKESVVNEMEKKIKELDPANSSESKYVSSTLAVAEAKFHLAESELAPIILTSPINGRVRTIDKLAGTVVSVGEPIVTISSPDASHIIGFIQQPLSHAPQIGDRVLVRSRGVNRMEGTSVITGVGPRVELFNSPLRIRGMGNAQQRGQPVIVNLPNNIKLIPGELVDLTLDSRLNDRLN